jgi:acetyl-CoA acetyltransferase
MRDVAIVAFGQTRNRRRELGRDEAEMLAPVVAGVLDQVGLSRSGVDFTCSGSSDFLAGHAFSFVMALDALGAWPPIHESHVEGEAAWALYEAWVKMLCNEEIEVSLVYGFGRQSMGSPRDLSTLMNDPYLEAPLRTDAISQAALQARVLLDAGMCTEHDFAEIAARNLRHAAAGGADDRVAPATTRLPPDHRRSVRRPPRRRRSGAGALRPSGMDPRPRPPDRCSGAGPSRPDQLPFDPARG